VLGDTGWWHLEFCCLDLESVLWGIIWLGHLSRIDSLLNAATIFESCYALFSGLAFIGIVSVLLALSVHRMLHRFHAEERE
jgi:hypothetical protein